MANKHINEQNRDQAIDWTIDDATITRATPSQDTNQTVKHTLKQERALQTSVSLLLASYTRRQEKKTLQQ